MADGVLPLDVKGYFAPMGLLYAILLPTNLSLLAELNINNTNWFFTAIRIFYINSSFSLQIFRSWRS